MAKIVEPNSLLSNIDNIISAKKQINKPYIDLTIGALYRVKAGGKLDFGGSEFEPGFLEPCIPGKNHPEDSYGWWVLHEGYFLLEYNETFSLPEKQIGILQPHPHLLSNGCSHPTLTLKTLGKEYIIPLWVPKIGVSIKENARISQVLIIETN